MKIRNQWNHTPGRVKTCKTHTSSSFGGPRSGTWATEKNVGVSWSHDQSWFFAKKQTVRDRLIVPAKPCLYHFLLGCPSKTWGLIANGSPFPKVQLYIYIYISRAFLQHPALVFHIPCEEVWKGAHLKRRWREELSSKLQTPFPRGNWKTRVMANQPTPPGHVPRNKAGY